MDLPPPNCVRKPCRKMVALSFTSNILATFSVSSDCEARRAVSRRRRGGNPTEPGQRQARRGHACPLTPAGRAPSARSEGLGAARPGSARGGARVSSAERTRGHVRAAATETHKLLPAQQRVAHALPRAQSARHGAGCGKEKGADRRCGGVERFRQSGVRVEHRRGHLQAVPPCHGGGSLSLRGRRPAGRERPRSRAPPTTTADGNAVRRSISVLLSVLLCDRRWTSTRRCAPSCPHASCLGPLTPRPALPAAR